MREYKILFRKKEAYKAEAIALREKKSQMSGRLRAVIADREACLAKIKESGLTPPKISTVVLKERSARPSIAGSAAGSAAGKP